jgi:hypothetical protein
LTDRWPGIIIDNEGPYIHTNDTYDVTNHIKGKVIKERFDKDFSVQNIFLFAKGIFFLFNTHDLHHFSVYCVVIMFRLIYNLHPLYFRHAFEAKKI